MDEDMFSKIYLLSDEERELIQEHMKFYADFNRFGNYILDTAFSNEILEDYELTIYSNLYKILELLDTLKVMTKASLINSGFYILRVLLESSAQLRYLIDSKEKMCERATILQMFDIKRTAVSELVFYKMMSEMECYKNYVDVLKNGSYSNWYSYCEGKRMSIEQLFAIVGWSNLYTNIYKPLSKEVHGVTHMESNIEPQNGKFFFKAFRSFENHTSLIVNTLNIVVELYSQFFMVYNLDELKKEWDEYESKAVEYIKGNKELAQQFGNFGKHFF